MSKLSFQPHLRPLLQTVFGPKEYHDFRDCLEQADRILLHSGLETAFVTQHVAECFPDLSAVKIQKQLELSRTALRYSILLSLTGASARALAARVADSHLFQWFVCAARLDAVHTASKSAIDRYEKFFPPGRIDQLIHDLNHVAKEETSARELLHRKAVLHFDRIFADCTCIKANIHHPVDWVLLRDSVRTLIAAVKLIRKEGLKHRMGSPGGFLTRINGLCMKITHSRRQKGGMKLRKKTFREMKKVTRCVASHAERHLALLEGGWEDTRWSEIEAGVLIGRIGSDRIICTTRDRIKCTTCKPL